jgi:cell division protease FtsH
MKESNDGNKAPKKSFLYYYGLVMLVLMLLNIFIFPSLMDRTEQVRYDQFVDELNKKNVDEVYVTTNGEIVYTLKDSKWKINYKTGSFPGDDLQQRITDAGVVKYSSEIPTQASPLLNFLVTWILPLIIFIGLGQLMSRAMMKRMEATQ